MDDAADSWVLLDPSRRGNWSACSIVGQAADNGGADLQGIGALCCREECAGGYKI